MSFWFWKVCPIRINLINVLILSLVSCCAFGKIDERFYYFIEVVVGSNLTTCLDWIFKIFDILYYFFLKNPAKTIYIYIYIVPKLPMYYVMSPNQRPYISTGQKWWWIVLEIEISCSQWKGSACIHDGPYFSLLWVRWGEFFLFFPCSQCVPNMFSSCFLEVLQVPKLFPNTF